MLVIDVKSGGGIITPYRGDGIFDFGKILLKKALNSNLIKEASRVINSKPGQAAISAAKKVAQSELGQELQKRTISEAQNVFNKVPEVVKKAARSELGQKLQDKIVSEVGKNTQKLTNKVIGKKAEDITRSAFQKLGIAEPSPVRKRKGNTKAVKSKKRKGKGFVYPQGLLDQFVGTGIILE